MRPTADAAALCERAGSGVRGPLQPCRPSAALPARRSLPRRHPADRGPSAGKLEEERSASEEAVRRLSAQLRSAGACSPNSLGRGRAVMWGIAGLVGFYV